jgi:uncharacterized protein YdhG (YjbR/CyaY superfamily)
MAALSPAKAAREAAAAAAATLRIDAILAALPIDQRRALQDLRTTIQATAPDALDGFSYGMPAFRYRGRPLVAYGAFKDHCSFFPLAPAVIDAHRDRLAAFTLDKGTIRFTPDHVIPEDVVASLVRARMAMIDGA